MLVLANGLGVLGSGLSSHLLVLSFVLDGQLVGCKVLRRVGLLGIIGCRLTGTLFHLHSIRNRKDWQVVIRSMAF